MRQLEPVEPEPSRGPEPSPEVCGCLVQSCCLPSPPGRREKQTVRWHGCTSYKAPTLHVKAEKTSNAQVEFYKSECVRADAARRMGLQGVGAQSPGRCSAEPGGELRAASPAVGPYRLLLTRQVPRAVWVTPHHPFMPWPYSFPWHCGSLLSGCSRPT